MKKKILSFLLILIALANYNAQQIEGKTYILEDLNITGDTQYKKQAILSFTKLKLGEPITIPGNQLSFAVKRLMQTKLFNDVEVFVDKIEGDKITLQIKLQGLSVLNELKVEGLSKGKLEDLMKKTSLKPGVKVTDFLLNDIQDKIESDYKSKGFQNADATVKINKKDSANLVDVLVNFNKGKKVKIKDIQFEGNTVFSATKLRKKGLKKLNRKGINIFVSKKYTKERLEEDRTNLINHYRSYGYRDAKINYDTVFYTNDKKDVIIKFNLDEGKKYYIRDIKFIGNTVYPTEVLNEVLAFKNGEVYDVIGLNAKVQGDKKEDDISTLYQNSGYIFARIEPIETAVVNDSVDIEIRINEGELAHIGRIDIQGNDVTFDHVVLRNLPMQPGDIFTKDAMKQTYYRLGSMGTFDAQKINYDMNPNPQTNTVDMTWKVEEQGSSQVQLQGGYGGGRFIGTLGLTLNNFSAKNIFKPKEWNGFFPQGDGQILSLNAQAGSNYQNYSFTFTEPWLFGKRPTALTISLYHSIYKNSYTDGRVNISGIVLGLNHTLNVPDSYFRLSHSLNYRRYNLDDYRISNVISYTNGTSHNINYKISFGRFSAGSDPVFPTYGSDISVTAIVSPPYSWFRDKDFYKVSDQERQQIITDRYPSGIPDEAVVDAYIEEVEDERKYHWLEFYKIKFKSDFYKELAGKLVLRLGAEAGYLGNYNDNLGVIPFERFLLGGTGLMNNSFDGSEAIPLRGYEDPTSTGGGTTDVTPNGGAYVYDKFTAELRYPISMNPTAKIYGLAFFDAAAVGNELKKFQPFEMNRSLGIGLRVFMSMFGLLGIDFAYGMDPYYQQTGKSGWQTHFIFGQQF